MQTGVTNPLADFFNILINTTSIALLIFVVVYAIKQRTQTAAPQLAVTTFFLLVWALGSIAELFSPGMEQMLLWRNITQIGVFYAPAASLMFAMTYTGAPVTIRKRLGVFSYALQTTSVGLIFTDAWLHLMRVSIGAAPSGRFSIIVVETTLLAKLMISFNFVFLTAGFLLLVIFAARTNNSMRRQVILTAVGTGIIFIFALLKVASGERFIPGIPISGVFGIACLALLLGIIRYNFLKVLPIARNEVMNLIDEGIVVASSRGEILDVNDTALRFFSRGLEEPVQHGEKGLLSICELLQRRFPDWYQMLVSCRAGTTDISQDADGRGYYYQCSTVSLDSKKHRSLGTISVMRDVTEQKMQNDILKQRAEQDGLLGILNRQTFFERAELELMLSEDESSLIFFDVDNFKQVNDSFGHIAGDHALRAVCACIQRIIGPDILFGRTGGEEFAILFRGLGLKAARSAAERIRREVEQERIRHQGQTFGITISVGIASGTGVDMQHLYQRADRMLYQAKSSGKNCCSA